MSPEPPARPYQIDERISARARRIRIEIHSADCVRLIIPRTTPRRLALDFLHSRESWVHEKLAALQRHGAGATPPIAGLRWDGHDRLPLRGQETPVLLVPAQVRGAAVRFDDGIRVFAPAAMKQRPQVLEEHLRRALRQEAGRQAQTWLQQEAERLAVSYRGPRMADQRSLWGSCTRAGLISLNWRLLLAPADVFRYVVIHELCHRLRHDHSPQFWKLVEQQMPAFRTHRQWLREHGQRLQHYLPRTP